MRYFFLLIVLTFCGSTAANTATANDWMFRPSYYSHAIPADMAADAGQLASANDPMFPQPVPRSAYRRAYAQLGPGFALRSNYRFNIYRLRSGQSQDTTYFRNFAVEATGSR
ncbi:hypothetical protein GC176_19835 [bacterium]|nr:hypothetical protein [bacterium]